MPAVPTSTKTEKKKVCPVETPAEIDMPEIEEIRYSTSTCDEESELYDDSCSDGGCAYWSTDTKFPNIPRIAHYNCQRETCPGQRCGLNVCSECFRKGKHKRHKRYLYLDKSDSNGT